jgi:hypothetical protein
MSNTGDAIPLWPFGRHKVKISALGFGGHHLGDAPDESSAVRLVRQAVDGGITFFDYVREYPRAAFDLSGPPKCRPSAKRADLRRRTVTWNCSRQPRNMTETWGVRCTGFP